MLCQYGTVVDFFHKFTAMLGSGRGHLRSELTNGFPSLPPGCSIVLEKQAEEIILNHIARQIPSNRSRMLELVRASGAQNMEDFLRHQHLEPELVLHHGGLWYQMQHGINDDKREETLARFVREIILQATSTHQLGLWEKALQGKSDKADAPGADWLCQEWGAYARGLWDTPHAMWQWLVEDSARHEELLWWIRRQMGATDVMEKSHPQSGHLRIFGSYTQKGIKWALGRAEWGHANVTQSGVERLRRPDDTSEAWLLYVSIKKSEKEYSRDTMYRDWAVTADEFQWESPNNWVQNAGAGKQFIKEIQDRAAPVFLFVRESKRDDWKRTIPYTFLGPVTLIEDSLRDERPIAVRFKLFTPMPTAFFRRVCMEMVA